MTTNNVIYQSYWGKGYGPLRPEKAKVINVTNILSAGAFATWFAGCFAIAARYEAQFRRMTRKQRQTPLHELGYDMVKVSADMADLKRCVHWLWAAYWGFGLSRRIPIAEGYTKHDLETHYRLAFRRLFIHTGTLTALCPAPLPELRVIWGDLAPVELLGTLIDVQDILDDMNHEFSIIRLQELLST